MSENGQSENMPEPKQVLRSLEGPKCDACGATMNLVEYRAHPTLRDHELRTYKCPACSREEVLGAPRPALD
jgi:hypothetical protein